MRYKQSGKKLMDLKVILVALSFDGINAFVYRIVKIILHDMTFIFFQRNNVCSNIIQTSTQSSID